MTLKRRIHLERADTSGPSSIAAKDTRVSRTSAATCQLITDVDSSTACQAVSQQRVSISYTYKGRRCVVRLVRVLRRIQKLWVGEDGGLRKLNTFAYQKVNFSCNFAHERSKYAVESVCLLHLQTMMRDVAPHSPPCIRLPVCYV